MKKKLVSGILTGMFALAALIVGVYALIKVGMTFSGGIGFNPNGVYVELSAQVYRGKNHESLEAVYDNPTYTLEKTSNYSETEGKTLPAWKPENVLFTPLYRYVQYRVSFKNLSNSDITVVPSDVVGVPSECNLYEDSSETLRIKPGETENFMLNFELKENAKSFSQTDFSLSLDIRKTSEWENSSYFTYSGSTITGMNTSSSYSSDKPRCIVLPESYGGNTITATADSSDEFHQIFKGLVSETKYVVMADTMTYIGRCAFRNISQIRALKLSENLEVIGTHFFSGDMNTAVMTIPKSVKDIMGSAFGDNLGLKYLIFEEDSQLESISGDWNFSGSGLKSINLPKSLKTIGNYCFISEWLETLTIPASVTSIGWLMHDDIFMSRLKWIYFEGSTLDNSFSLLASYAYGTDQGSEQNKTWVRSDSSKEPADWTNKIESVPATGNAGYYHRLSGYTR